jgi:hypothetical protein
LHAGTLWCKMQPYSRRHLLKFIFYREAGVTTWGLDEKSKSLAFWDRAISYGKYDFEYRLTLVSAAAVHLLPSSE